MNEEQSLKLIEWATGDDTGVSSESICRFMLGLKPNGWGFSAPYDAADRGRCIRLLNLIPEWWDRLDKMAELPRWKEQIELIRKERLS